MNRRTPYSSLCLLRKIRGIQKKYYLVLVSLYQLLLSNVVFLVFYNLSPFSSVYANCGLFGTGTMQHL